MPNCIQLISRETNEATKFSTIDDRLCQWLGVEPDKERYHAAWYDIIGFRLALGQSFAQIKEYFTKEMQTSKYSDEYAHLWRIADWLETNYTCNAWAEIGRAR